MTEHLPECVEPQTEFPCQQCWEIECECICICNQLRACEERVIAAAVQRVEALWSIDPSWDGTNWNNALHAAIAGIKGDQP